LDHTPKSDHKTAGEVELEQLENSLRTVQLALQILTGVCATLPDPEPDVAVEGDGDDENEGKVLVLYNCNIVWILMVSDEGVLHSNTDAEMTLDDPPSADTATSTSTSFLPVLVQPLLALIHTTPLSFPPVGGLSCHPPITSAISAIHVGALECLNNIFLSLSTSQNPAVASDKDSGRKVWDEVWSALGVVGTQSGPGQERKQEIWEIAIGVMWGIGSIWKGFLVPNEERIKLLIQFCDASSNPRFRVKCIGTLECLAQHPESIQINGVCLLSV
jgi:hypothetical protein